MTRWIRFNPYVVRLNQTSENPGKTQNSSLGGGEFWSAMTMAAMAIGDRDLNRKINTTKFEWIFNLIMLSATLDGSSHSLPGKMGNQSKNGYHASTMIKQLKKTKHNWSKWLQKILREFCQSCIRSGNPDRKSEKMVTCLYHGYNLTDQNWVGPTYKFQNFLPKKNVFAKNLF